MSQEKKLQTNSSYRPISPMNRGGKILKKKKANESNPAIYIKNYAPKPNGIYPKHTKLA